VGAAGWGSGIKTCLSATWYPTYMPLTTTEQAETGAHWKQEEGPLSPAMSLQRPPLTKFNIGQLAKERGL
jgi:hypothetical protein